MRAFCTVSAPLEVCASSAEQLSPGSRFLTLRLLGNQQPRALYFLVDAKSRVREVYTQTCLHFSTQGMLDTELFGLAVLIDGEYLFADPESKLSKYGPKSWRSSHTHGLDANGRPLLELYFRVQFYIESPLLLKDETTRHNYYLQLKYNALHRDIPCDYSEQSMIILAGLALQADLGDVPLGSRNVERSSVAAKVSYDGKIQSGAEQIMPVNINPDNKLTESNVTTATTTTLPKICKGMNMVNERVLRLSRYIPHVNQGATTGGVTIGISGGDKIVANKFQKHTLYSPIPLSPASSTSSISRGPSSASTNASTSTNASSRTDYFRLEDYLPPYLRTARAASTLRACHRENRGMSSSDAKLHYIQHACIMHECINAHTFRMRLSKNENGPGNSWFIVYAKGIIIFSRRGVTTESNSSQQQITFLWPNITKLSFERKKFEIRSGDSKITLFATCDEKNKMLLTLCRDTHQFSMKISARLKEVIKREEDENNCLHSNYIYSRSLHLPPYKNKSDQRISVISSTSSNTTSGIVSDRVHSEDELEIMINSPPVPIAAPSTESLALAHLLDQPSVSRQTSSVGQISLKDLKEHLAAMSIEQNRTQGDSHNDGSESPTHLSNTSSAGNSSSTSGGSLNTAASKRNADESSTSMESPTSQHNIGSQCSSTCSTVVVASSTSDNLSSLATLSRKSNLKETNSSTCNNQRRNSTSSSLELGFSHTAQNSMLSEVESTCIGHDFTQIHRDENDCNIEVYTMAGGVAPTETSGVYTMNSSELTGQSSEIAESEKNSTYDMFHPRKSSISNMHITDEQDHLEDSVDGGVDFHRENEANNEFRLRSDSNISTSGSFRGDGSDPTENKYNLLSVEELTDLIVGRGTYPNRKTVSHTLDSDCDYVTLPLSIAGESYLQGHQDTAPTEDNAQDLLNDFLPRNPPTLPQRIDSQNIHVRSPPPYNFRHRKTGLCGPPVTSSESLLNYALAGSKVAALKEVPKKKSASLLKEAEGYKLITAYSALPSIIKRKDPPPYSLSTTKISTSPLTSIEASNSVLEQLESLNTPSIPERTIHSAKPEEITARFITTRPQINILKAHTTIVNDSAKPSFAAPTNYSSTASLCRHHLSGNLSQHSVNNSNYVSGSQTSLNFKPHHHLITTSKVRQHPASISATAVAHAHAAATGGVLQNSIGIPISPYTLRNVHKSMSSLHQQQTELKAQQTCVLLPVIKPRQYLPPPPPSIPRQPPPPPPPTHFNVYPSHVARKQLELYQQQLCSDVDYVIYPLQDPAVSQQEYLDAKQGSILAAMAQSQVSHHHHQHPYLAAYHQAAASAAAWETWKGHALYRSTPYLPLAFSSHSRYASTQNLSDSYVQLPNAYSPIYSPSISSLCSSYDTPPPPPPPSHPSVIRTASATTSPFHHPNAQLYVRSLSDENILNSLDLLPKVKRLPPPPPPPPYINRRLKKPPIPTPTEKPPPIPTKPVQSTSSNSSTAEFRSYILTSKSSKPLSEASTQLTNKHITPGSHINSKTSCKGSRSGTRNNIENDSKQLKNHNQHIITTSRNTVKNINNNGLTSLPSTSSPNELDIALLREKSKNLDLPLISALCNDRLLLKQTKMLVNPLHRIHDIKKNENNSSLFVKSANSGGNINSDANTTNTTLNSVTTTEELTTAIARTTVSTINVTTATMTTPTTTVATTIMSPVSTVEIIGTTTTATINNNNNNNNKLSTVSAPSSHINNNGNKGNKANISHRHPNDKLPPLPMQMAEANNYVMDPAILKHHKSYNSHT